MRNVYFNHDGSVDDLVSLLLLLQMSDVHLTGVGVVGADSYLEPALAATRKVIDRFGHDTHLEVAASDSRGVHPFPKEWRLDAFSLDALPILNESGTIVTPVAPKPAHLDLVDKLQATSEKTTLVMTGPLTDLARALQADPSITAKIEQLYWMGEPLMVVAMLPNLNKTGLLSGMLIGTRRPLRLSGIVTSLSKWLDLKALVKSH